MKVSELIAKLQEFDPDMEVVTPGFDESDTFVPVVHVTELLMDRPIWAEPGSYCYMVSEEEDVAEVNSVVVIDHGNSQYLSTASSSEDPRSDD